MEMNTNPEAKMTSTASLINKLESSYRRFDYGQLNGRNASSSDSTRDWNWRKLQAELVLGGYKELDATPRLAARYYRLERRHKLGERYERRAA